MTTPERTRRDMGWVNVRSRSDIERDFLRLIRRHQLPLPEVNGKLGSFEIDFLWRRERLAVELDSYAYHSSRASFVSDRARDRELQRRGFVALRFADEELTGRPSVIVDALQAISTSRLASASPPAPPGRSTAASFPRARSSRRR